MINHTANNDKPEIQCKFGDAIKELGISRLLRESNIRKKRRLSIRDIPVPFAPCVPKLQPVSFPEFKKQDMAFSKNTYYRFVNDPGYNWQRFLTLLSARVVACFSALTRRERVKCLVLDDSVIERSRSKQVELLSWIYNHVTHKMVKGFNMLTLGWTDSYSFVPVAFNMMASADPDKHITGVTSGTDRRKSGYKRRQEAVCHKPDAAMAMIRSALKAGIRASYILMDTWFTNEPFINNILEKGLDVIGMLKDNKQLYRYHGKLYNLKSLSKLVAFNKAGNIFGSITVATKKFNIPVKLVFVRNRNKTGE